MIVTEAQVNGSSSVAPITQETINRQADQAATAAAGATMRVKSGGYSPVSPGVTDAAVQTQSDLNREQIQNESTQATPEAVDQTDDTPEAQAAAEAREAELEARIQSLEAELAATQEMLLVALDQLAEMSALLERATAALEAAEAREREANAKLSDAEQRLQRADQIDISEEDLNSPNPENAVREAENSGREAERAAREVERAADDVEREVETETETDAPDEAPPAQAENLTPPPDSNSDDDDDSDDSENSDGGGNNKANKNRNRNNDDNAPRINPAPNNTPPANNTPPVNNAVPPVNTARAPLPPPTVVAQGVAAVNGGQLAVQGTRDVSIDYRNTSLTQRLEATGMTKVGLNLQNDPTIQDDAEVLGYLHGALRGVAFTGSREGLVHAFNDIIQKVQNGEGDTISVQDRTAALNSLAMDQQLGLTPGTTYERNTMKVLDQLYGTNAFTSALEMLPPLQNDGRTLQLPPGLSPGTREFYEAMRNMGYTNANFENSMLMTTAMHDLLDDGLKNGSIMAHELAAAGMGTSLIEDGDGFNFKRVLAEFELSDGEMNGSIENMFYQAFGNTYGLNNNQVTMEQITTQRDNNLIRNGVDFQQFGAFVNQTIANFASGFQNGVRSAVTDTLNAVHRDPVAAVTQGTSTVMMNSLASVCPYLPAIGGAVQSTAQTQNQRFVM